jgi:hypothetical protein
MIVRILMTFPGAYLYVRTAAAMIAVASTHHVRRWSNRAAVCARVRL